MLIKSRIESYEFEQLEGEVIHESLSSLRAIGERIIAKSIYKKSDIGLLIYTGIYRSRFLVEPSMAALVASELELTANISAGFLAFDILNGSIGFLNALQTAEAYLQNDPSKVAMIISCEIDNNREYGRADRSDMNESASAVILDWNEKKPLDLSFLFRKESLFDSRIHLELQEEAYLEINIAKYQIQEKIKLLDQVLSKLDSHFSETRSPYKFFIDPMISRSDFLEYSSHSSMFSNLEFSELQANFVSNNFVYLWANAEAKGQELRGFILLGSGGQGGVLS